MDLDAITAYLRNCTARIKIMEVCGTHTSAIMRNGIRALMPEGIKLVSGPGCPVCVTPPHFIDELAELSLEGGAEALSFGDMFRVPGVHTSLTQAKARGAKIRLMYSPFEAVALAKAHPGRRFVVAAVGFETTAPVYAALIETLIAEGIENVMLFTALKTMPEALGHICQTEDADAFLCPGHVSAVIGSGAYAPLCEKYQKPFVIAGFEAAHILAAIYAIARQKELRECEVVNLYPSAVSAGGQAAALALTDKYFEKTDALWRGIGEIKNSGLRIRSKYSQFSANGFGDFRPQPETKAAADGCRCADVVLGRAPPSECPLFGKDCTPQNPAGACMASQEGACGVYFNYGVMP